MLRDLRYGARALIHAKGWASIIVLSLALGIGANTALFSVASAMLLKTIPVEDPHSLLRFRAVGPSDMSNSSFGYGNLPKDTRATFSFPMFLQMVAENRTLQDLFACAPFGRVNMVVDGQAEIATAFISTGNYYRLLGVVARPGRTLTPEDDKPGAPPAAVISHRYWVSRFGSNPGAVGKTVNLNNVPVTIVGVLPAAFTGIQQAAAEPPDVSVPLSLDAVINPIPLNPDLGRSPVRVNEPTWWWLQIMGRAKPGVTAAQVQANLATVFQHTARAGMDSYLAGLSDADRSRSENANRTRVPRLQVESGSQGVYDAGPNEVRSVAILSSVVGLVLLIVCANVANLLLSRATTRRKEIAIRLSMGATRGRLVSQLLTESLLLAFLGGALAIPVAYWGLTLLPGQQGRVTLLDWRVLGFIFLVTGVTGLLFGIAPALRATRVSLNAAMKEQSRSVVGTGSVMSRILLIVQVAVSLVLLVGAGLFLRTVQNLRHVDVGFNPNQLVLFRVNPQLNRYDEARTFALYADIMDRLRSTPGVRAVALSQPALLSGSINGSVIFVQGRTYQRGWRNSVDDVSINRVVVSPSFFETLEMPVTAGREFSPRDDKGAPRVAMINDAAARKYFPNQNPIGQRFGPSPEDSGRLEIVGIVRDAKYDDLREPAPPTMYVPYLQNPGSVSSAMFEVRAAGDPAAAISSIRDITRRIDPNLPLTNVSTQIEQVELRFGQEKVFAQACTLFGALALLLASIGLFGLMSYNVGRRTNEIGIRMALGAQRQDVLRLVMGESLWMVLVGVAIGLAIALASSRFVASLLFGVTAADAATLVGVTLLMMMVSALAGFLPARRASRIDPLVALHEE